MEMARVQLECAAGTCKEGPEKTRWKTPAILQTVALRMLKFHMLSHGLQVTPAVSNEEYGGKSRFEKLSRPTLSSGTTMKVFKFFLQEWVRYKCAAGNID